MKILLGELFNASFLELVFCEVLLSMQIQTFDIFLILHHVNNTSIFFDIVTILFSINIQEY